MEISVVIPTYNRKDMLKDMLNALSHQTLPPDDYEVVVVVDGSTDGTWEMLQEIDTPFSLRPFYQENAGQASDVFSSGVSVARNLGAKEARGSVVLFLDDDLLPLPELLEAHATIHRSDTKAVALGRLLPSDERNEKRGWNIWEERVLQKHYRLMELGDRPPAGWRLYSGNFSVSRDLFQKHDGFDLQMGHVRGEDVELGLRLENDGARFYFAVDGSAIHRGYRSFTSWCNSALILGVRDVVLARDKGYQQLMSTIFRWHHAKSRAIRWTVRYSVDRKVIREVIVAALRVGSGIFSWLRMHKLAHAGYSVIFNLYYWHGVTNELGDIDRVRRSLTSNQGMELETQK